MARGTWNIYVKLGAIWVSDGTIYRPNDDLNLVTVSTQKSVSLANGSRAYYTPSTKYLNSTMEFKWDALTTTFVDKIKGYITSQNDIKIINHNSAEYIGRFVGIDAKWIVGSASTEDYDIIAKFEQMPSLA